MNLESSKKRVEAEDLAQSSNDYLVTETTLAASATPAEIVAAIRYRKTTGQLIFHLSQGGIQRVVLVERTKTSRAESDKIREAIWNGA